MTETKRSHSGRTITPTPPEQMFIEGNKSVKVRITPFRHIYITERFIEAESGYERSFTIRAYGLVDIKSLEGSESKIIRIYKGKALVYTIAHLSESTLRVLLQFFTTQEANIKWLNS